jgi:hypothetical protein
MTKVIHLPTEIHQMAKEHCRKNHLTLGYWITELMQEAINEEKAPGEKINIVDSVKKVRPLGAPENLPDPKRELAQRQLIPVWQLTLEREKRFDT